MDYYEAFKHLKNNRKYERKSPHKAILLLSVIDMFENGILTDNVIYYDDNLKRFFQSVWQEVLKDNLIFHPTIHFPFWYLQNDKFWH